VNPKALHPLDQVVDRFGRSVADVSEVPGGDLVAPTDQRAAERSGLDGIVLVLEVVSELRHPLEGDLGIGVCVGLSDSFLRFPTGGDVPVRITSSEQTLQFLGPLVVEPLLRLGQQTPASIEGIGLPSSMTERLVLDPPAALIELGVGELADMKGVGHQGGVRHHDLEDVAIGAGQIEGAELDSIPEGPSLFGQPPHGLGTAATRDDVEQLSGPDIDQLGREVLVVEGTDPDHEHLVESEGGDLADAILVGLEQGFAIGDDGVVHGVPVTPELAGHLVHTPGMLADLESRPPGGAGGEELSRSGDPVVLLGPAAHGAITVRAHPPALPPHQSAGTSLKGQVDEFDPRAVLHLGGHATRRAAHRSGLALDMDLAHATRSVLDAQEPNVGKSDHPHQRALGPRGSSIFGR